MAKRKLELVIVGNVAGADAAFKKAGASAARFGNQTEHVHTRVRKSFAGLSFSAAKMASGVAGAYLGLEGVKKVVGAAEEAQVSQAKLATQLKASGVSFEAHKKVIDETVSKYAAMSGFMDHNVDDAFTSIVRVTGNVNKSLKLTGLAADFARARHMDLTKAGELVGKVAGGNVGILSRYGLSMTKVTTATDALAKSHGKATIEQKRAAAEADKTATANKAIAFLQKKFAGQAEAYGKTAAGAQDRMKVAVDHLEVAMGNKLLPVLTKVFTATATFVQGMQDGTGAGGRFAVKLKEIWASIKPIVVAAGSAAVAIGAFVGHHPAVQKLAVALVAVGVAVKAIKFAGAITGLSTLLGNMGKATGPAKTAGGKIGTSFATKFVAVAAAGVIGWDMGTILRAKSGAVRSAGDFLGRSLAQAFGVGTGSFQNTVDGLIGKVQDLRNQALSLNNANPKSPGHGGRKQSAHPKAKGASVMAHASDFFPGGANMSVGSEPELARRLNALSRHLGVNFTAVSGWRSPQHSVAVGGTANDPHTRGQAVDVSGGNIQTIPESVLNQFGLTRPMQTWQGRDERNHIQLYGGGPSVAIGGSGGGSSKPKGPSPAQLKAIAKKIAGAKKGGLNALKTILGRKGPGPIRLGNLPSMGDFGSDVFSSDSLLNALHGSSDFLQAGFDSADRAATGRGLRGALSNAASAVRNAKAAKGESADAFSKRMGGLVGKVRDAKAALNAFTKEGERAKALKTIDLKIKGVESAKAFKDAISGIRQSLHDAAKSAADAFRTLREGEISKAHDAAITAIGDSADAKELARLQGADAAQQDAKTTEQLNQALADAIKAHDVQAQKDAQDAIDAYTRQKREDQLTANIVAATQAADDAQTVAMNGLDKEVADFQSALDTKLQAEADQLNKRVEGYKTFLANVNAAVAPYGLTAADVVGSSSDQEAAINSKPANQWAMAWLALNPGKSLPHRAGGGSVSRGSAYIVGERGQEMFVPDSNGRIVPNHRMKAGGVTVVHNGDNVFKTATDHDRWANKLAFRLATA